MAEASSENFEQLAGQECPFCRKKALTMAQREEEIPYFGRVLIFSMNCNECKFHKADVESMEQKEAVKYTIDVTSEDDMNIRVVKSSAATIKVPRICTITPGPASNGYVTNVEGILNRIKVQTEQARDNAEDDEDRKKAKNMVKKLQNIMWGRDKTTIIIEDPTGNSAIISDKAVKGKL
jgi:zinc finger protein